MHAIIAHFHSCKLLVVALYSGSEHYIHYLSFSTHLYFTAVHGPQSVLLFLLARRRVVFLYGVRRQFGRL